MVLDDTFTTISSVHSIGGVANFDEHEFNVLPDGSSLFTLYNAEHYDLSNYNITTGQGWIMNNFFQRIEIGSNRLLFEWSAIDHVLPNETFVAPNSTEVSGDGLGATTPWDYFHINSVDMNSNGDYLISARHTSTVYKISGKNGTILWRLGGIASDFTFPPGLNFSSQHDARFLEDNATTTVLSLFDNASNGYNQTSGYSSGMILILNHTSESVTLLRDFVSPFQFVSQSQGNMQILNKKNWRTSNVFMGWGKNAFISEYKPGGRMVQMGYFAIEGAMHYRAFKQNFTSNPTDAPALYAYALNTSTSTTYWMSWNGATKVASWRVYSGPTQNGPWNQVGWIQKNGFETQYTATGYYPWSIVEALDANGKSLRKSIRSIRTFVPSQELAAVCDGQGCPAATAYSSGTASSNLTGTSNVTMSFSLTASSSLPTSSSVGVGLQKRGIGGTGVDGRLGFAAMFGLGALIV